jgi:hypothetical protein
MIGFLPDTVGVTFHLPALPAILWIFGYQMAALHKLIGLIDSIALFFSSARYSDQLFIGTNIGLTKANSPSSTFRWARALDYSNL